MISNNYNRNDKIVELTPEKKSDNKKRRIAAAELSVICVAAVCFSVAAQSGEQGETAQTDLTEYAYTTEAAETTKEELPEEVSQGKNTSAPSIPSVNIPKAAPSSAFVKESAFVSSGNSREASPMVCDVSVRTMYGVDFISAAGTVEDALLKAGIDVDDNDLVAPSMSTALADGLEITVVDVSYFKITTEAKIPFDTEYVEDETLPVGETKILTYGEEGVTKRKYLVKKTDGEESDKKLLSEEVVSEPVTQIVANGTMEEYVPEMYSLPDNSEFVEIDGDGEYSVEAAAYGNFSYDGFSEEGVSAATVPAISQFDVPKHIILDENNAPINYIRTVYGKSCAYTAEPGALMSTGKEVFQGYVAVNPDIIPYGSKMYIVADDGEVYGYAIAGDTGGSVRKNDIVVDLFMWEYDECMEWGAKNVTIYILEEGE